MIRRHRFRAPFLKNLRLLPEKMSREGYPFNLPFLMGGNFELGFETPITFFVGENGTGKSTLLEAIAEHCGFNVGSGSRDHAYEPGASEAGLASALRLSWLPKVTNGFFFRSESFFNFASYVDELSERWPGMRANYGERPLHGQSHGESFLALFRNRLGSNFPSIYLMDEPETALSPARQLVFLKLLGEWHRSGNAQLIIATHAPIIMSYPKAQLYRFDGAAVTQTTFEETEHYQITRAFLMDPEQHFAELFDGPLDD